MRIKRKSEETQTFYQAQAIPMQQLMPNVFQTQETSNNSIAEILHPTNVAPSGNIVVVRSPMIGTFYRSSSPDKEPFVKTGDQISKKQIICIIEAMKLFNEIESEIEGKVVRILVENAQPVEYDQPLFEIEVN